ncbi:major facilitator superfamily domain-containing protein [Chaetomium strumarium]|uniref:Major facilitator superfamily domain-containing protein n=1 Tax=Chaetomium strumarium TaxID=1170767 RepID=A0AAJ0GT68_9PEZI|nr:major facilitator superfamily domain-containing protein [Chaetomium strumarium]
MEAKRDNSIPWNPSPSDSSCTAATKSSAPSLLEQLDSADLEKTTHTARAHTVDREAGDSPHTASDDSDSPDPENADHDDDQARAQAELARLPSAAPTTATTIDFPEGGVTGWLVVLGSFSAMLSLFGLINSAAVFESYFSTHQLADKTASEIGWIFSLYLFIVFFVGIQVGPIFDHFGARLLVAVGSLLIVLSLVLLSFCDEYYQIILTYSVMGGLGGALLNSPAYGAIAHFFNVRRGLATGVASTAGGVGGVVFPVLLRSLLPNLGFAWSCRILALIMLGLAVPSNLFIRTRLTPAKGRDGRPKVQSVWPDFTVFRDARFAFASIGIFFMEWGLFVPVTFIVSFAAAHGQDATESYLLLSYLNAGSVLGRVLPGFLADRFGRFNIIIVTIALCVVTVLALWLPAGTSKALLIVYSVLFGIASGSNLGLMPVCLGQLCDHRRYGRLFSTAMMVASFGTLSSVPIGGALLDSAPGEDGWRNLIIFSGIAYFVALVCYGTARVLAVGWNPRTIF